VRDDKLLHIYLSDHLAASTAGLEVAKRCLSNNQGTALGEHLTRLIPEIDEDRRALESFMQDVGAPRARLKRSAGWLAEKVGRLKFNGRITGYSPLSRLLELEGLSLGIAGKAALWQTLKEASASWRRMRDFDFDHYIERATRQQQDLERFRSEAAQRALGESLRS
jgi:hypothetical protein